MIADYLMILFLHIKERSWLFEDRMIDNFINFEVEVLQDE